MATLVMPVRSDILAYKFSTTLDGTVFVFQLRFNRRMNKWIINIRDEDENPILMGIPLFTDFGMFIRFKHRAIPDGELIMIDLSGNSKDADIETLGEDVILAYEEASA